jgi:hypothetical protein
MKTFKLIVGILLLCALPTAQSADTDWYAIEVVVFENAGPDSSDGELWTDETLNGDIADAVVPESRPSDDSPINPLVERLRADPRYKVLYHNRWLQDAAARSSTAPARITNAPITDSLYPPSPAEQLDGFVRLHRARFLQVEADLAFRPAESTAPLPTSQPGMPATGVPLHPAYVLHEKRRVKFDEIHYIDHPKFGMLIMVSKATAPQQP